MPIKNETDYQPPTVEPGNMPPVNGWEILILMVILAFVWLIFK